MTQPEPNINLALARCLALTRHAWRTPGVVMSEETGKLVEGAGKKPDILIVEPLVSPVVIETELQPALGAEGDALQRLGTRLKDGTPILSAIALKLPARLKSLERDELDGELSAASDMQAAVFTGESSLPDKYERIPASGWLSCGLAELSVMAQSLSLPPTVIDRAAEQLMEGVHFAAEILADVAQAKPGADEAMAIALKQAPGEQTRKMAATILSNAFVFHGTLARGLGPLKEIRTVAELERAHRPLGQGPVLEEWDRILKINYWPIFDIACRLLVHVPDEASAALIRHLQRTASQLISSRLMRSHDLTGAVFQRMIVDRKFLAAFYTKPESAALLINLVLNVSQPLSGAAWGDVEKVTQLTVADLACGTGTLLSTAYQRIGQLHELAGGNAEAIHAAMMEGALIGVDVLPAAAHLTASMLAGVHPTTAYYESRIDVVNFGVRRTPGQKSFEAHLGSLDLLRDKANLLGMTSKRLGATEVKEDYPLVLPDHTLDAVLMNPPFTRPTGNEGLAGEHPMFAAFSASKEDQEALAATMKELVKSARVTSAHGNAGEASLFLALAHRKLKIGGQLGLVLPLSLLAGDAWEGSRRLLGEGCRNLIVVSISGAAGKELSFSADTGMGECIVVAQKSLQGTSRGLFVILNESPRSNLVGLIAAHELRQLCALGEVRRLEDGPYGGTALHFGGEEIGQVVDAPLPASGGWNLARIADISLAQTAYLLSSGRLWLPGEPREGMHPVSISSIGQIGNIGPYHMDINAYQSNGAIRGPFDIIPADPEAPCTYPTLWGHDAKREQTMMFPHDSEARLKSARKPGDGTEIARRAELITVTASHCHHNRDWRFNSQPTPMQFTSRKAIGGRAWPSVSLASPELEKTLVLWANTTFGILLYWWIANKQQDGRGSIPLTVLGNLPVLNVAALTPAELAAAVRVFDESCQLPLLPAHLIDMDENRHVLDRRLGVEVLGLPASLFDGPDAPVALLRRKLAAEPSIHGHKGKKRTSPAK